MTDLPPDRRELARDEIEAGEEDPVLEAETEIARAAGATSPASWWRIGLVVLAILVALVLIWQLLSGNPGTNVVPGTPTSAPQTPGVTSPAV
jgi:hypothetical protein